MTRVAALVPAYNEEETIASVVETLRSSPHLTEVIVISDGSHDKTAERAREAGATVFERFPNQGKGQTILYGLSKTDAPIIAFMDADLIGLTVQHVDELVVPVIEGKRVMNVGLRDRGTWITELTRHLPLISGERVFLRKVIEQVPASLLRGYQIETALNYACRSHGWSYGSVFLPGLTIRRKYQKVGYGKAVVQYLKMFWEIGKAMILVRIDHF